MLCHDVGAEPHLVQVAIWWLGRSGSVMLFL